MFLSPSVTLGSEELASPQKLAPLVGVGVHHVGDPHATNLNESQDFNYEIKENPIGRGDIEKMNQVDHQKMNQVDHQKMNQVDHQKMNQVDHLQDEVYEENISYPKPWREHEKGSFIKSLIKDFINVDVREPCVKIFVQQVLFAISNLNCTNAEDCFVNFLSSMCSKNNNRGHWHKCFHYPKGDVSAFSTDVTAAVISFVNVQEIDGTFRTPSYKFRTTLNINNMNYKLVSVILEEDKKYSSLDLDDQYANEYFQCPFKKEVVVANYRREDATFVGEESETTHYESLGLSDDAMRLVKKKKNIGPGLIDYGIGDEIITWRGTLKNYIKDIVDEYYLTLSAPLFPFFLI